MALAKVPHWQLGCNRPPVVQDPQPVTKGVHSGITHVTSHNPSLEFYREIQKYTNRLVMIITYPRFHGDSTLPQLLCPKMVTNVNIHSVENE